jgi:oligoribonuclease NrnB/cAMP/cGMP phosphodiesterase (DHH superfamily)
VFELPKEVDVVLYHGSCPDGFAAAHIVMNRYGRRPSGRILVSYAMNYGEPLPLDLVRGADVMVVDFSWKRAQMEELAAASKSMAVIDHHKTAEAELVGLDYCYFDMNRSGAGLAWDLLFPEQQRPWWVDAVEDRDLWRFKVPNSLALNAYIMAQPHSHAHWNMHIEAIDSVTALQLGNAIRVQIDHYVEGVVAHRQTGFWGDYIVTMANAPYLNSSDVGEKLLGYGDIGLIWFERGDQMIQFGLRSKGDLDVSKLAISQGGGGHKNAAGFQLTRSLGRKFLDDLRNAEKVMEQSSR